MTPSRRPSPLPGAGLPPRGLFLDRWGTLLRPVDSITTYPELDADSFVPGAIEGLFQAGQEDWHLYLLGNESAVAHGHATHEQWLDFQGRLEAFLQSYGVPIRRVYACLDDPAGKPPHDKDSVFFLPNTGAFYHAAQTDGISLPDSWVVGDGALELVAGWRAGLRTMGVRTGEGCAPHALEVEPEEIEDDLRSAVESIVTRKRAATW